MSAGPRRFAPLLGLFGFAGLVGWGFGTFAPSVSQLFGLAAPGPVVDVGLPAARVLAASTAAMGVANLLVAAVFVPGEPCGTVSAQGYAGLCSARRWWLAQAVADTTVAVLTVVENAGIPPARLLRDPAAVIVGLEQIQPATGWLVSALVAVAVAAAAGWTLSWRGSVGLLTAGSGALLPAALTSSVDAERSHDIAGDALALHVVASVLWLGSALAVTMCARRDPAVAVTGDALLRRHSRITAWCLPVVGGSGLVSAAYAIGREHLFDSGYGRLVVAGVVLSLALAPLVLSRLVTPQKRRVGRHPRPVLRIAVLELPLLVAASGVGTGLTRLLPPAEAGYEASRYVYLIGYDLPVPITALDVATRWRPDLVFGPLALIGAVLYLLGVRRLHRAGRGWPASHTTSWLAGCATLVIATCSGVATYAPAVFSDHMVQHMLLATVVPVLLVLGHGVTLVVGAGAGRVADRVTSLVHSTGLRLARSPLISWAAVAATLFGLYPTGLFALILQEHWAHLAMDMSFLGSGLAVFWAVLGKTPSRDGRGLPAPGQVVLVFALMALHAGFSIWLLSRPYPIAGAFYGALQPPARPDLMADQRMGAILGWILAEAPVLMAVIALVRRWGREDRPPTQTKRPGPRFGRSWSLRRPATRRSTARTRRGAGATGARRSPTSACSRSTSRSGPG